QYNGPLFGYASMNFFSEFLAAVEVYEDYPTYFGQLALDKPRAAPATKLAPAAAAAPVKVAARTTTPKAKAPAEKYKVRNGDTLFDIAQRFGTSVRELMEKNNLRRSAIYAGQILAVK